MLDRIKKIPLPPERRRLVTLFRFSRQPPFNFAAGLPRDSSTSGSCCYSGYPVPSARPHLLLGLALHPVDRWIFATARCMSCSWRSRFPPVFLSFERVPVNGEAGQFGRCSLSRPVAAKKKARSTVARRGWTPRGRRSLFTWPAIKVITSAGT